MKFCSMLECVDMWAAMREVKEKETLRIAGIKTQLAIMLWPFGTRKNHLIEKRMFNKIGDGKKVLRSSIDYYSISGLHV